MALFRFLWLRRLIRNHTSPIPEDRAAAMKRRLSIAYMLISWNAFGIVAYLIYNGKADWAAYYGYKDENELKLSPGQQWAKTFGMQKAEIYRVKGFSLEKVENPLQKENEPETSIENKL